jgi:hypothetical protein
MSDYVGRCAAKGWKWKPLKLSSFDVIADADQVGVACCTLETAYEGGFNLPTTLPFEGSLSCISKSHVDVRTEPSVDKRVNIQRYTELRAFVESTFQEADRAILATKKSPTQIQILKCGAK